MFFPGWSFSRNSFQTLPFCAAITLSGLAGLGPAQAIDCTKAETRVEQATCANANLKQIDAKLAKSYFGVLRSIAEDGVLSERDVLLADQRDWLQRRETLCGAADDAALPECIRSAIDQRSRQLTIEWGASSLDRDLSKGTQLSIGAQHFLSLRRAPIGLGMRSRTRARNSLVEHAAYMESPLSP